MTNPTLLGHVGSVSGGSVSIRQAESVSSGISIIGGRSYRVGQVGSFVRIPQGYHDLYGIIAEVGANATPETMIDVASKGERWLTVQLVGEIIETTFERGVSQYPSINDEVHLVTEDDLARIYGTSERGQVQIGRLAGSESIPVRVDLDKLVTRHSAVLGSTGSGKSTTVASLLRSLTSGVDGGPAFSNARIMLLDIHGEYATALSDVSKVFKINSSDGERPLVVPYWALDLGTLLELLMGRLDDKATTAILDKIHAAKLSRVSQGLEGVNEFSMTAATPVPFSLKTLWFDLIDPEVKTWANQARTERAISQEGDAETLRVPNIPTNRSRKFRAVSEFFWSSIYKTTT